MVLTLSRFAAGSVHASRVHHGKAGTSVVHAARVQLESQYRWASLPPLAMVLHGFESFALPRSKGIAGIFPLVNAVPPCRLYHMHIGPYEIETSNPVARRYGTVVFGVCDGVRSEIRLLDRLHDEPTAAGDILRRLKLIEIGSVAGVLPVIEADWEHNPPYLVVPVTRRFSIQVDPDQLREIAARLIHALASAHRRGLSLGTPGAFELRIDDRGELLIDLTGTGSLGAGESTRQHDVAVLGHYLASMSSEVHPSLHSIFDRMCAERADDRPMAEEAAAWFTSGALERTMETGADPVPKVTQADTQPSRMGRFVLKEVLGQGGMGTVYRGEDIATGEVVAVKTLRDELASSDRIRMRFIKEGRILAAIDSPHITRFIDANVERSTCYLAMEFVRGQSLGKLLSDRKKLDESLALDYIADAARGMAVAHRLGIIHRDLKPDNLLVLEGDAGTVRLKVTDFGLGREVDQSESLAMTRIGSYVGTPYYMPPEQFGKSTPDSRSDVYALGATLFHLLTGRTPFTQTTLPELVKAIAMDPAPSVESVNPAVSSSTSAFVARCLSKEPTDRPADAEAFLVAVERLIGGEPTDILIHPRIPKAVNRIYEYSFEWLLQSPPERLWPHVSNTERLNKSIGLPSVDYTTRRDENGNVQRYASARLAGMKMEWIEHPFEWIEGRRMGVLREFFRGPLKWFLSTVELHPADNGGTRLRHTLRAEPRNWIGHLAARRELNGKARRSLDKVYRLIDRTMQKPTRAIADDPFEIPAEMPVAKRQALQAGISRLRPRGVDPMAADLLEIFITHAPDQEAARIRPLVLADRFGIDPMAMSEACLHAVPEGLLALGWDVICPLCKIPSGRKSSLRELKKHENCPACAADFVTDFAESVELVFSTHPDLRKVEAGTYCSGGPGHSPHVIAQVRLQPDERIELDLALSAGLYRVRSPQLTEMLELRIRADVGLRRWQLDLAAFKGAEIPPLAVGSQVLSIVNRRPAEMTVRIERMAPKTDALTAARAIGLPAFRSLFPGEILAPEMLAPASSVTFFIARISGIEELQRLQGEANAFQIVQEFLRAVEKVTVTEGGTVVKTFGDLVVTAFAELAGAIRTATTLMAEVRKSPLLKLIVVQAGVHRGMAYVTTVNDRLDYFGRAVQMAVQLAMLAEPGRLLITSAIASQAESQFAGRTVEMRKMNLPGGEILAYQVLLE
jgi:eukaryotic-like serine/threonine-protein kinase